MTVTAGTRFGPYEVVAPIGAGGMGEVFKARDTRLERSVAIKILSAEFVQDAQFRLRFEREAKTISQLSHPNICTLYDVGDGYLVMELLEGQSLAEKLVKGPLPIEQVLRYGIEIAEALDKAHKAGVVHRDLKPGNVMITKSGAKLLDFGLAKPSSVFDADGATQHKPLTQEGSIVGTFQYMAPEQIEGGEVDARTDIFAFGAMLHEMATGRRAFEGKSKASLIASILTSDPQPISAIQPMTPAAFDRIVRACLAKDPDARWQSAHDVAVELRWISESSLAETGKPSRRNWVAWAVAAALLVGTLSFAVLWDRARSQPRRRTQTEILPPPGTEFYFPLTSPVISPDGEMIAFSARGADGKTQLWVRRLDTGAAHILTIDSSFAPFWSPDGRTVAYFAGGKLKRIDALGGGSPEVICDAPAGRGGTWSAEGKILFAPSDRDVLYLVPASGGTPVRATELQGSGEYSHRWPWFLPDGRHFLYLAEGMGTARGHIYVGTIGSNVRKQVVAANSPALYSATGHILYCRDQTLVAQPFDVRKFELSGDPVPLANPIRTHSAAASAAFTASRNGILVYQEGASGVASQLSWFDRSGKQIGTLGAPADIQRPSISHDGRYVAFDVFDNQGNSDVWIYDLARQTQTRFTFDPGLDTNAIWSPDDRFIVYHSEQVERATHEIILKPAGGIVAGQTLFKSDAPFIGVTDMSADGRTIIFHEAQPHSGTLSDIFAFSITDRRATPIIQSPFSDLTGRLSPDGRWLAYGSNESGRNEIYVVPFPTPTSRIQISSSGGSQPRWSRDGHELYYSSPDNRIMAAALKIGQTLEAAVPQPLFNYRPKIGGWAYDVSRDGRFLVNQPIHEDVIAPFTVVLNWDADLKK